MFVKKFMISYKYSKTSSKFVDLKDNAAKHLASLFVAETNRLKSGRECHWKFDESIITKAQKTIREIESFEEKLTVIKQNFSDIFKCDRYFVNEKKRMHEKTSLW